jgi:hypothetical protein
MVGEDCWSGPHLDFRVSSPSFSKYNAHILLRDHDQGRIRAGKSTTYWPSVYLQIVHLSSRSFGQNDVFVGTVKKMQARRRFHICPRLRFQILPRREMGICLQIQNIVHGSVYVGYEIVRKSKNVQLHATAYVAPFRDGCCQGGGQGSHNSTLFRTLLKPPRRLVRPVAVTMRMPFLSSVSMTVRMSLFSPVILPWVVMFGISFLISAISTIHGMCWPGSVAMRMMLHSAIVAPVVIVMVPVIIMVVFGFNGTPLSGRLRFA